VLNGTSGEFGMPLATLGQALVIALYGPFYLAIWNVDALAVRSVMERAEHRVAAHLAVAQVAAHVRGASAVSLDDAIRRYAARWLESFADAERQGRAGSREGLRATRMLVS